jgi:large subunit ribosomal protein L12
MEYVYAALLLHSTKQKVSEENVKKVMTAAGAKVDDAKVKALIASLDGVNIEEAMKKAVAVPAAAPAAPAAGEAKAGEKKEKKPKEDEGKKEEEAAGGLASLFG